MDEWMLYSYVERFQAYFIIKLYADYDALDSKSSSTLINQINEICKYSF